MNDFSVTCTFSEHIFISYNFYLFIFNSFKLYLLRFFFKLFFYVCIIILCVLCLACWLCWTFLFTWKIYTHYH